MKPAAEERPHHAGLVEGSHQGQAGREEWVDEFVKHDSQTDADGRDQSHETTVLNTYSSWPEETTSPHSQGHFQPSPVS